MSLTPIEDEDVPDEAGTAAASSESGVRGRLRAAGRWLLERLRSMRPSTASADEATSERERTNRVLLAPRGESESTDQTLPEPAADSPTARPAMPGEESDVDTERDGDSFRVYDPNDSDAYVTSDEWVPVER